MRYLSITHKAEQKRPIVDITYVALMCVLLFTTLCLPGMEGLGIC